MTEATAEVRLHGRRVGTLRFVKGGSTFDYTDDLLAPDHRVLGQVFEERPRGPHRQRVGLPPWFANLVPEQGSGLRRWYAAQLDRQRIDDGRLLVLLGNDLSGAVTVHGDETALADVDSLLPPHVEADDLAVRFSLAGAQLKFSLLREGERLTVPSRGGSGDVIVKFADRVFDRLPENEFLMMRWLAEAGFDVPDADLVPATLVPALAEPFVREGESVYVVRRFDRPDRSTRVHMEDFAQLSGHPPGPAQYTGASYDGLGAVIRTLCGERDFTEYLGRLVAMVLMGNTDAHLKNWALLYPDGRSPRLAPVYDVLATQYYTNFRYQPLTFGIGGERLPGQIGLGHFRTLARAAEVADDTVVDQVTAHVDRLVAAWRFTSREPLGVDELVRYVDHRLTTLRLVTESRRSPG